MAGEPDQDYDHEFFDTLKKVLRLNGFDSNHREFDKYQGVYLHVQGVDTFWIAECYVTGTVTASSETSISYKPGTVCEHIIFSPEDEPDVQIETILLPSGKICMADLIRYCKSK